MSLYGEEMRLYRRGMSLYREGMSAFKRQLFIGIITGFLCIAFFSCGPRPLLKINYKLPATSETLSGIKVAIDLMDQRSDLATLDKNARHELKNFSGQFSYSVEKAENSQLIGVYDLSQIMKKTLKRKLESLGAKIVTNPVQTDPVLTIILKEFLMTFNERVWEVEIIYEAQLSKDQKILAREEVAGSGTRVKIVGRKDADKLMGDIYSDVMNQLNYKKLFKNAEMLP